MNAVAMQSFGFGDQLVRVVDRAGTAWFVGNDVCAALEIANRSDALKRLEDDERDGVGITDPIGREQQTTIISESGVYALVFTSRKEAAKRFRRWVTQEVLPTIRRTGRYEVANDDPPKGRVLDLEGALGTQDDRHAIKTALLTVQMYTDLYGQQAGRDMMAKLGFPVPEVDLPPAPAPAKGGGKAVEGDIHQWGTAVGIKHSKRDATHLRELFESYTKWCGTQGQRVMHPDRFKAMIMTIFGHEEHPEMVCAVITRRI